MFGKRADGWLVKGIDPVIALTPYLMPMRCDAQVMLSYKLDYDTLVRFIAEQAKKGHKISFTEVFFAAYVRAVSQNPEVNRFVAGKRLYARKDIMVSFVVLQDTVDGSDKENVAKCRFDPRDTLYDIAERVKAVIASSRRADADNSTLKIATLLSSPIVANPISLLARLLDRWGLMPRFLIDASPFHTGMFFSSNASIGLPPVYHHIYNFGTTSLFVILGSVDRGVDIAPDGQAVRRRWLPAGVTVDERVCAGVVYSKFLHSFQHFLNHPYELENPPEKVFFDQGHEIRLAKPDSKTVTAQ